MTWRLLLALAAYYNWEIEHIDIVSAFLNGDLDENVYIKPIEGLDDFLRRYPELNDFGWNFDKSQLLLLVQALYGLKQSPRQWQLKVKTALKELGFKPLISDESTYYNVQFSIFIVTYVDDFLIFGPSIKEINRLKEKITEIFDIKDLGPIHYFLGIQILRDRPNRTIKINQSTYIQQIIDISCLTDIKTSPIPLSPGLLKNIDYKSFSKVKVKRKLIKEY